MSIEEFDDLTKQQLLDDDQEAWNALCSILLGIISIGLALALLAIVIVL